MGQLTAINQEASTCQDKSKHVREKITHLIETYLQGVPKKVSNRILRAKLKLVSQGRPQNSFFLGWGVGGEGLHTITIPLISTTKIIQSPFVVLVS